MAAGIPEPQRFITPYSDLGLKYDAYNASTSDINEAYGTSILVLDLDPDNPFWGHARLKEISDAREVLQSEQLRTLLVLCLRKVKHLGGVKDDDEDLRVRAWRLLNIREDATADQITQAYKTQMALWTEYERYVPLIRYVMVRAREWMLREHAKLAAAKLASRRKTENAKRIAEDSVRR